MVITVESDLNEHGNLSIEKSIGVCLACFSYYPLYAGPALRFQRYAPGLRKRGAAMRVFTQAVTSDLIRRDGSIQGKNGGQAPDQQVSVPEFEILEGTPIQRVPLPSGWRRFPEFYRALAAFCRRYRDEIDVVQFLNLDFYAAPWLLQLRKMGMRMVFTHTLLGDLSPKAWRRSLQRLYRLLPLTMVDRVVVSSGAMREQIYELGLRTPVEIIPNGVDLKRFHPSEDEEKRASLRRELGLDSEWLVILAVGPVIPRKGTDALVKAFVSICHEYPHSRLLLVGPRHDLARDNLASFHREMEAVIRDARAQERVIFTGAVSDVQAYYQAADILVFPSRREGMPNVVPEAMASGLPVILTPFTGLPEEFGCPGTHYILSDWEPLTLASDLRRLLSDSQLRNQLSRSGKEWIETTMSFERSLDLYVDLYLRLSRKK